MGCLFSSKDLRLETHLTNTALENLSKCYCPFPLDTLLVSFFSLPTATRILKKDWMHILVILMSLLYQDTFQDHSDMFM